MAADTMETYQFDGPGRFWLVPKGHPIPSGGPTKQLFVHVIPKSVTYQILIDVEVSISNLFEAILHVEMDEKLSDYNLFYKQAIANTLDATTKEAGRD